jgi:hypothetical protein
MKRLASFLAMTVLLGACAGRASFVRAEHAREFGCQERWVAVTQTDPTRLRARGCGFESVWDCEGDQCALRHQQAAGAEAP